MKAPSQYLPACPLCSNILVAERPFWRRASNTSAKRGKHCFILQGCAHAVGTREVGLIREDPEEWKIVEETWQAEAEKLFAFKTASWTDAQRDRFRRAIEDKHTLPGATDALPLEPIEQQKSDAQTKTMARVVEESPFGDNL